MGKLDPQAVKCIFVGYASTQKGYKCWDPIGKRLFVSMDVTFREEEPYYTKKGDLDQFLDEFSLVNESDHREGEDDGVQSSDPVRGVSGEVIVGGVVPQDVEVPSSGDSGEGSGDTSVEGQVEMVNDDVVVVGTILCPTGEKVNEEQGEQPKRGEQPIVYFRI